MPNHLLNVSECVLVVVDIQEKLLPHIANRDDVLRNVCILIEAARRLEVPALLTEQYPQGLGPTVEEVRQNLQGVDAFEKTAFGCWGCEAFSRAAEAHERRTLVIAGIEAHVCVLQTVLPALDAGWRVAVVADAVGSRRESNRDLALARMRGADAAIVSTEMVVAEWLADASHPRFKDVSPLIR